MLDLRWVEALHTKLFLRYGERWLRMWADVPTDALRRDWAEVLHGMSGERIAHGLANLPNDNPPNAAQFRAICLAFVPTLRALPAPAADPDRVRSAMAQMTRPEPHHPKAWAWRLKDREEAGERLSAVQRRFWREALQHELGGAQ